MPRHNTPEDFWVRVQIGSRDECWPWQGPVTDRGYGKTSYEGKCKRAHQVAFYLTNKFYPPATLHKCDNPPCCNPEHLFAGTNGSNNTDRASKGRSHRPKNELHPNCRLSNAEVAEIRALAGTKTYQKIADQFSISNSYAWQLINEPRREL